MAGVLYAPELLAPPPVIWLPNDVGGIGRSEAYDLQRYHPAFSIGVVDQVMEDIRRGMESNLYSMNQRRIASIKFMGELYIYRLVSSGIIFDTLWTLVTFGHRKLPSKDIVTVDRADFCE